MAVAWLLSTVSAAAMELLGDKAAYVFMAVVFTALLEAKVDIYERDFDLRKALLKSLEECIVYSILLAMAHAMDVATGLADTCRRVTLTAILAEKTMAALKAASVLGYSKITDVLEDVYAYFIHKDKDQKD